MVAAEFILPGLYPGERHLNCLYFYSIPLSFLLVCLPDLYHLAVAHSLDGEPRNVSHRRCSDRRSVHGECVLWCDLFTCIPKSSLEELNLPTSGIFLVTFVHCLRILLWIDGHLKPVRDLHWKMVIAAVAMFVVASLDVAFHVRHNLDAFVSYEGDPVEEFSKTSNWINVMKMGCFVAQTFVGDAILLYRCWIIYDRRWLVIATSTVLWLGCTVCGVVTVYVEATHDTTGHLLKASTLVPFMASMLCLTLVTNVLTTGLIVRRILRVQRKLPVHRSVVIVQDSPLTRAAVVMIESGLIYTVSMVVLFVLYMAGNNGMYGVSNSVVQIIGITFNLIITSADRRQESSGGQGSSILTQNGTGLGLHRITIQTTVSRYPPDPDVDTFKYPSASPDAESVRIPTSAHRKSEWIQDGSEP